MDTAPRIWRMRNGRTGIVLPGYFLDERHREKEYTDGLYGIIPRGRIADPYARGKTFCTDVMEWAYNNPRQPGAETDGKTGKRLPFLDGSGANRIRVLGSLKEAWKAYERESGLINVPVGDIDVNALNAGFFACYERTHPGALERSAEILRRYMRERRSLASEEEKTRGKTAFPWFTERNWDEGCRDFVRHLVWKTPKGYLRELMFFSAMRELTGAGFLESDVESERRGIDGYLTAPDRAPFPVCIKPSTWSRRRISPVYEGCMVIYMPEEQTYPDAVFEFLSGGEECLSFVRSAEPRRDTARSHRTACPV